MRSTGNATNPIESTNAQPQWVREQGGSESKPSVVEYFRSKEVVEILGVTRRQLQYWAQTDLVRPSQRTRGGHHRYTFEDLVALKATARLIEAGVSVQRIRKSVRALRQLLPSVERPLSELVLVATGDVVLVFRDQTVFEALSGQEWVFRVAHFQEEVQKWQRETGATRKSVSLGTHATNPV